MRNCSRCIQFEARLQKPGLEPIICMEPMDLVHIDYIKMEVTVGLKEKPEVKDVLVVDNAVREVLTGAGKAEQVQITCTWCNCKNAICVVWLFARLKNK